MSPEQKEEWDKENAGGVALGIVLLIVTSLLAMIFMCAVYCGKKSL